MQKNEIRLGIIGCQTSHSAVYTDLFNGRTPAGNSVPGGRVTYVWDYSRDRAQKLKSKYPELTVADAPEAVMAACDALLILTDDKNDVMGVDDHLPLVRQAAAAGKPAFVDKPLANTLPEAVEIAGTMRKAGLPLMSCSSFNWFAGFDVIRDGLDAIRPLRCAWVLVGNGCTVRYGIHLASVATTCLGAGIKTVSARGWDNGEYNTLWLAELEYTDGTLAQLQGPQSSAYVYRADVWGEKGHLEAALYSTDAKAMSAQYRRQMTRFIEILNGTPATDRDLDLPSIALTLAIAEAVKTGKPVDFAAYAAAR